MLNNDAAQGMATAVQLWLDFQVLCQREMLLSEAYLAQPTGEFLRSHHTGRIRAEWNHPNIQSPGRGRPRQIDYALFSRDKNRSVTAIEAKWTTDAPTSKQRLLDDVLRLECVRNDGQGMTRYFLIAGRTNHLENNCLGLRINVGGGERQSFMVQVLPLNTTSQTTQVKKCDEPWRRFYKSFQDSYNVELPTTYKTQLVADKQGTYVRVLVWRITSPQNRRTFSPADLWKTISVPDLEENDES